MIGVTNFILERVFVVVLFFSLFIDTKIAKVNFQKSITHFESYPRSKLTTKLFIITFHKI